MQSRHKCSLLQIHIIIIQCKETKKTMKVAEYISRFLVQHGVTHNFTVTGGGAMHLNDALGHQEGLTSVYNHHEQACAIAAESYARLTGQIASVCVTSGPGGTNAITGVLGGWQDSIPMFVISGQVKRETTTWASPLPLRQLGDQEFQIVECVKGMTKYAVMITEPASIRYHMEKAWYLANHGRKGPVWIDVPVDVQAASVKESDMLGFHPETEMKNVTRYDGTILRQQELLSFENPSYDTSFSDRIFEKLKQAKRPVILAGTGIRLSGAYDAFLELVDKLQIPVTTAWNAHDVLWEEHPFYCGRPGTVGLRGGNFVVQNSDLLLVFGCRLNIRQISYNYKMFAPKAYKIMIDIDEAELYKPTIKCDMPIHADVADVIRDLLHCMERKNSVSTIGLLHEEWMKQARQMHLDYPGNQVSGIATRGKGINPYQFMDILSDVLLPTDKIICGNGSACVISFQALKLKRGQRLYTNSGCAAMGYGFPAALGACIADKTKRIICLDGDGSIMMNLQELQTVAYHNLHLKIFIMNNNGYHSIRQTQTNLFKGRPYVGISDDNGVSFPDFQKIAYAFNIAFHRFEGSDVENEDRFAKQLEEVIAADGPVIVEILLDEKQNFEPKLSSRILANGSMESPEIDDMYPFLEREEYLAHKLD